MEKSNSKIKEIKEFETYKKESKIYAKLQENKIIIEQQLATHKEGVNTIHICVDYEELGSGS